MNTRLKILIIDNSKAVTGAFKSIFLVVAGIPSCEFSFALPSTSSLISGLGAKGIKILPVKFIELSKSIAILLYLPMLVWNSIRILKFIKKEKISIVHVNDIYNMCGVLIKILSPNTKVIYHVRLLPNSYVANAFPFFTRVLRRFSDRIVCNSQATKEGLSFKSEKISVIYNPIDRTEELPPKKVESAMVTTLVHLANFTPRKGHELAIEAFAMARMSNPSIRLILAGGTLGSMKNELFKRSLEKKALGLSLSDAVNFLGFQENVELFLKSADIVLNFSASESFSRVTLESLYYGTPVIATDSGGPSEIIVDGRTGILVPKGNVQEMSKAILTLSKDVQLQRNFSVAGREHVIRKFDARLIADQMEKLYLSVSGQAS